jgi:predicted nucleic acid-binding protein
VAHEVPCHADHAGARARTDSLRAAGDGFGLATQVLIEFVHIVTDPRRFSAPLTMEAALARARAWWDSLGMQRIESGDDAVNWFLDAMARHRQLCSSPIANSDGSHREMHWRGGFTVDGFDPSPR